MIGRFGDFVGRLSSVLYHVIMEICHSCRGRVWHSGDRQNQNL
jgi:hypothetical protein